MASAEQYLENVKHASVVLALLVLSGCALFQEEPPAPVAEPPLEPVVVLPAPAEPVEEPPPITVDEPPVEVPIVPLPQVAIVLSSRHPSYESIANELGQQLGNYTVFDLGDKSQPPISAFRLIEDSDTSAVVAIGLRAAISATSMSTVPVVFCQVFNIEQNELITDNSRGIASLPPLDLQIAAWKKINPELRSIGAIIGTGHEDLIEEAELAAATHGIELHLRTASSDRETLYLFNRLVAEIDGFWLFPDNRVLSTPVLKEMLTYAARRRVQIAVFNDSLLAMGATLSSSAVDVNIAEVVVEVLRQISVDGIESVPPVSPLTDVRITTNKALLRKTRPAETQAKIDASPASGK